MKAKVIKNIIFSAILMCVIYYISNPMPHVEILTVAGVMSTVAGILFGFVLAAISIFSSAGSNPNGIVSSLKATNILPKLISTLLTTGTTLIFACVFSIISMFIPETVLVKSLRLDFAMVLLGLSNLIVSIISFIGTWRKINWIIPHL
ncbi:hypothetical protein [Pantoea sp. ICBG 1758]|uniref:hypothetical protein n=1 Tax=Pantoea sp. ICBG 1758 TaxID=2071682 RepID=UPI001304A516|nr:hypothetical protein [Pantoea sp. ICBG 1758]